MKTRANKSNITCASANNKQNERTNDSHEQVNDRAVKLIVLAHIIPSD